MEHVPSENWRLYTFEGGLVMFLFVQIEDVVFSQDVGWIFTQELCLFKRFSVVLSWKVLPEKKSQAKRLSRLHCWVLFVSTERVF